MSEAFEQIRAKAHAAVDEVIDSLALQNRGRGVVFSWDADGMALGYATESDQQPPLPSVATPCS